MESNREHKPDHSSEPCLPPDDLQKRLETTINRANIALLLLRMNREDLIYTVLEDLACGIQWIIDYCVKETPQDK